VRQAVAVGLGTVEERGLDSRWCHWNTILPAALWSWG